MKADINNIEPFLEYLRASGKLKPEAHESTNLNDGALRGVECPECNNKGYIDFEKDGYRFSKPCKCMVQRQALLRARQSGLDEIMASYTFKAYQTPDVQTEKIKESAMNYVRYGDGKWFYISGIPGSGKTHICTAICSALLKKGMEVKYVLWRDIAQKLKSVVIDPEYVDIMESLKRPKVLYIDDFLVGTMSDADFNRAFDIINARYNMPSKRTIISSNRDLSFVRSMDEAVGSRIYQRSKGYCFKAPDINWRN